LKPEKTASSKKRKAESILSTEISESIQPLVVMKVRIRREYLFTSSKPFSSSKSMLAKSSHPTIKH
jgi:hypothetical protein